MNRNLLPVGHESSWRTVFLFGVVCGLSFCATVDARAQTEDPASDKSPAQVTTEQDSSEKAAPKPEAAADASKKIALVGGRILTMGAAGTIESGTILIEDKKITAVGPDVQVPVGVEIIDVTGLTVSPGLIDCRSSLWLARDSVNASSSTASLAAVDGVDAFSDAWIEVARQGITSVAVQPSGMLGGTGVVLRVAPASSVNDLMVSADAFVQASIGVSGASGTSKDRFAQYEALKKILDGAKAYQQEWQKYDDAVKAAAESKGESRTGKPKEASAGQKSSESPSSTESGKPSDTGSPSGDPRRRMGGREFRGRPSEQQPADDAKDAAQKQTPAERQSGETSATQADAKKAELPKKPKRDPIKDLLVRVLKKELPLHIEVHRVDDIELAFRLAKEFELSLVYEGLNRAGRSWDQLQEQHQPMIVGPFVNFENASADDMREDRYKGLSDFPGTMAIASFSKDSRGSRLLRFHAAAAVAADVSVDQALRSVTCDAARVLGIDALTGSIEPGKYADLMVVLGSPVDPSAVVKLTMSHGKITHHADDQPMAQMADADSPVDTATVPVAVSLTSLPAEYAIVSDRVLYPDGSIAAGAILVRDGLISAVHGEKDKTESLKVFDVGRAVVTPGLISGHYEGSGADSSDAVAAYVRAIDAFDPDNQQLKDLAFDGFTSVLLAPDSRSVISGQAGCVRILATNPVMTTGGEPLQPASKFVLSAGSRSSARFPSSLAGQRKLVHDYFAGVSVSSPLYLPSAVQDLLLEQKNRVLDQLKSGVAVSLFEANSVAELDSAIWLTKQHDLKAVILNPSDVGSLLPEIQEQQIGLVIRCSQITDHDWYAVDLAKASNLGIRLGIAGDQAVSIRATLATLVNAGMSQQAALRAVSSDAAEMLGLTGCGQLAPHAAADIVIWNGLPTNLSARPIHVIVDGRLAKEMK